MDAEWQIANFMKVGENLHEVPWVSLCFAAVSCTMGCGVDAGVAGTVVMTRYLSPPCLQTAYVAVTYSYLAEVSSATC